MQVTPNNAMKRTSIPVTKFAYATESPGDNRRLSGRWVAMPRLIVILSLLHAQFAFAGDSELDSTKNPLGAVVYYPQSKCPVKDTPCFIVTLSEDGVTRLDGTRVWRRSMLASRTSLDYLFDCMLS